MSILTEKLKYKNQLKVNFYIISGLSVFIPGQKPVIRQLQVKYKWSLLKSRTPRVFTKQNSTKRLGSKAGLSNSRPVVWMCHPLAMPTFPL